MNIIKIFSDAWAMAHLGPGPAPPLSNAKTWGQLHYNLKYMKILLLLLLLP